MRSVAAAARRSGRLQRGRRFVRARRWSLRGGGRALRLRRRRRERRRRRWLRGLSRGRGRCASNGRCGGRGRCGRSGRIRRCRGRRRQRRRRLRGRRRRHRRRRSRLPDRRCRGFCDRRRSGRSWSRRRGGLGDGGCRWSRRRRHRLRCGRWWRRSGRRVAVGDACATCDSDGGDQREHCALGSAESVRTRDSRVRHGVTARRMGTTTRIVLSPCLKCKHAALVQAAVYIPLSTVPVTGAVAIRHDGSDVRRSFFFRSSVDLGARQTSSLCGAIRCSHRFSGVNHVQKF